MTACSLAAIETCRLDRQGTIDSQRTARERNRLGQFATPPALALEIACFVKEIAGAGSAPVRYCDPAIGTGAFFSALMATWPRDRVTSATGIEIDPEIARTARDLWSAQGLQVFEGDFTDPATAAGMARPNLILTNPPYVRHHHLAADQKQRLQALASRITGIQVNGLAGLYVYYLLIAHALLEDGGLAAWLIPSEFMSVNYGAALRHYLAETVNLIAIHRFAPSDVQFSDALVSSAVVVFRKVPPSPGWRARFTFGGTLLRPTLTQDVSLADLCQARKWMGYPLPADCPAPAKAAVSLGDLFQVRRGIATGANDFFILPRDEARSRGLPDECLRPILPSPRYLQTMLIERDPDGWPRLEPSLALIDTELSESCLCERYPALWAYLRTAEERGILDRYLVRKRRPWYKQERRAPAPFLCTYMGRSAEGEQPFRFIWNRSDAIAPNVYLMLYPKGPLAEVLRDRPDQIPAAFGLLSQITGHDLQREGRVYGGGLHKIEPGEIGRIPAGAFLDSIPGLRTGLDVS